MSNPHLNFFRPYQDETHENELTRAALVVMRLVPLAHAEFIRLVDSSLSIAALPAVSFDTQTAALHPEFASRLAAGGQPPANLLQVISVFLTPSDEELTIKVEASERTWVVDGALRYGDRLVIVVESKLHADAGAWQAENIPLGALAPGCQLRPEGVAVPWHDLLESWMQLADLGLLNITERTVLADFFDLAGQNFADLLPFKTLARAGANETRIQRRARDLLAAASSGELDWDSHFRWWYAFAEWRSFERLALIASYEERLSLELWPAHVKPQARALYAEGQAHLAVGALNGQRLGRGVVEVSPDLFVRSHAPRVHIPFRTHLEDVADYLAFWAENVGAIHQYDAADLPLDWLVERGLVSARRCDEAREIIAAKKCRAVMLQPGLSISVTWSWADAVELDDHDQLVGDLRAALTEVLTALGERLPGQEDA
jgi:hypothetical protein